jgi:hypothetical protein
MVCILAKGSGDCASPAYHDHPPQQLLQNFPDTTHFALKVESLTHAENVARPNG